MLNKHNVLHKTLYTLHKMTNGLKTGSQAQGSKHFGHAVVVAVGRGHKVRKGLDLGHAVGHYGGHTGLFQHGTVVFAVTHG